MEWSIGQERLYCTALDTSFLFKNLNAEYQEIVAYNRKVNWGFVYYDSFTLNAMFPRLLDTKNENICSHDLQSSFVFVSPLLISEER